MEWQWERVWDDDGYYTGLIRVFGPEQITARRRGVADWRRPILSDPDNIWSDYKHPDDWPMDLEFLPDAIAYTLARWKRDDRNGVPHSERLPFPERCEVIRQDETRCWNWANHPERSPRCKFHQKWEADDNKWIAAYVKQQIIAASPMAADTLERLAYDAKNEAIQLKAATEILDRAGVRAGTELDVKVEVSVSDPAQEIRDRLSVLSDRQHALEDRRAREEAEPVTVSGETLAVSDD